MIFIYIVLWSILTSAVLSNEYENLEFICRSCCYEEYIDAETVIGIDLGTTYTSVGVFTSYYNPMEIIPDDQGNRIIPSYVAFTPEGEILIGDAAKKQLTINPENTIFDMKRFIGKVWDDPTVQSDIKNVPFKVIEHDGKPHIQVEFVNGTVKTFTPGEITAMILIKMKEIAEAYLGQNMTHAVVTVPAYFNEAQRQSTKDAGIIAGLNVTRIINEPTAAAIASGFDIKDGEENLLVFDLGGGALHVTLLTVDIGVFEIVAKNGDSHLGGQAFDQRIVDYFMKLYKEKDNDFTRDKRAVQKLRLEVEKAKHVLSIKSKTSIKVESFFECGNFSETLTRNKFEELNIDLFQSGIKLVEKVLQEAEMNRSEIDEILLVGGSTRIPKIRQLVKEYFDGKEPYGGINRNRVRFYGAAAFQAHLFSINRHEFDNIFRSVSQLKEDSALNLEVERRKKFESDIEILITKSNGEIGETPQNTEGESPEDGADVDEDPLIFIADRDEL